MLNEKQDDKKGFALYSPGPTLGCDFELFLKGLDQARVIISLGGLLHKDFKVPRFLTAILAVVLSLHRLYVQKKQEVTQACEDPRKFLVKDTALRLVLLVGAKALCSAETGYYQLAGMIFFRAQFICSFLSLVVSQSNYILVENLARICDSFLSPSFDSCGSVFFLYGGTLLQIQRLEFEERLSSLLGRLNVYLSAPDSFILGFIKTQAKQHVDRHAPSLEIFIRHLTTLRTEPVTSLVRKLSALLFQDRFSLSKEEFVERVRECKDPSRQTLFMFIDICRVEALLSEEIEEAGTGQRNAFYVKSFEKLLKKCPFNGDSSCECKKCQCIRRNRTSANLNQQRKREAITLVGPLSEKVRVLERRNDELEEENKILRGLVIRMSGRGDLRGLLLEEVEPCLKMLSGRKLGD